MSGTDIVHVPYKGSTQARQDVVGGQVQLAMDGLLPVLPLVRDGRLKPLALTSSHRSPSAPEIPTMSEAGVPGYVSDTWYGLLVPAGTPKDVIAKLHAAAVKALNTSAVRDCANHHTISALVWDIGRESSGSGYWIGTSAGLIPSAGSVANGQSGL